jgi:epoxyqueuosine reductase
MVSTVERGTITRWGRAKHGLNVVGHRVGGALLSGKWDLERLAWVARLPVLPAWARRHHAERVWRAGDREIPEGLKTVAGIWRDPEREEAAYRKAPLHAFFQVHAEGARDMLAHGWAYLLPTSPRYMRAIDALRRARRANRGLAADTQALFAELTPAERSRRIRAEAERLGLSAVGFAAYDPKYSWEEFAAKHERGSVIVCVYEQDHANTQTAPSAKAERAAFFAYAELCERAAALSEFVQRCGGKAQPHGPVGEALVIPYGVAAGLGQLGLNGQLLTPAAGSRSRISLITTNVELAHDEPKDFGVNKICDACQVCARRCPVGAIPIKRAEHRGITKAKIKTDRCFPVVARVEGCAICMKTCPVQMYGLDAVVEHYEHTGGEILGKGTDELEGYTWPPDGRFYGAGAKPPVSSETLVRPEGWVFDGSRTEPGPLDGPAVH